MTSLDVALIAAAVLYLVWMLAQERRLQAPGTRLMWMDVPRGSLLRFIVQDRVMDTIWRKQTDEEAVSLRTGARDWPEDYDKVEIA